MLVTRSLALVMKISTLCVILSVGSLLSTSSHAGDRRVGDPTVPRYASKAAHELLSLVLWEVTGIPNHRWTTAGLIEGGKAQLGEPFAGYVIESDSLAAYAESPEDDLRPFASRRVFYFPVISGGRCTTTILVTRGDKKTDRLSVVKGNYVARKGPGIDEGSPSVFDWAIELLSEYPRWHGCEVALIFASTEVPRSDGRFLFLKCRGGPGFLAPTDEGTLALLLARPLPDGRYEFIPINEAARPLKEALRERLIDETYAGVEDTREYMRREELELIRSRPDLIQLEADFRYPYVAYPDTSRIERLSGVSILRVFVVGPRMSGMDALKVLDGFPTFDLLKTSGLPSVSDVVLEYWRPYGKDGYIRVEYTSAHFH